MWQIDRDLLSIVCGAQKQLFFLCQKSKKRKTQEAPYLPRQLRYCSPPAHRAGQGYLAFVLLNFEGIGGCPEFSRFVLFVAFSLILLIHTPTHASDLPLPCYIHPPTPIDFGVSGSRALGGQRVDGGCGVFGPRGGVRGAFPALRLFRELAHTQLHASPLSLPPTTDHPEEWHLPECAHQEVAAPPLAISKNSYYSCS